MTNRSDVDPLGDDVAPGDDRDGSVALVDAPAPTDADGSAIPSGDGAAAGWAGAPPAREPSRLARIGRRVVRRPMTWAQRPWPTDRIVKVTVTGLSLLVTTYVMLNVVHLNPLNPTADLVLERTTPTGGDMGAHVWGPAYLRDNLLPNWQLNGWSMDWYAGMPVYRFYMLTPALAIVALDVLLPYGVAFKIVAVSGLVFLPTCCWAFGKLASFRSPIPQLFAFAGMAFALQESYSIYGGNLKSTMAGEFSFSIALSLGVLGLGLLARAMQTGRYRNWAAIVLALAIVSHGIVSIYVALAAVIVVLVHLDNMRRFRFGALLALAVVALSAFWIGPFLGNHDFMTDMKYGGRPDGASDSYWDMFFPFPDPIDVLVTGLAVVGFVASVARRHLTGTALGVIGLCTVALVYLTRDSLPIIGLLWNPRLLPLLYLVEFLLAMVGAVEIGSVVAAAFHDRRVSAPGGTVSRATTFGVAAVFVCFTFAFFFEVLPGGTRITEHGQTVYAWGPLHKNAHPDDEDAYQKAQGSGWSRYNFEGYEGRPKYPEYYDVVQSMTEIGARDGCGRALWENNGDNGEYGTTMALMLLPFWTDGCITSMEGLFFEASGTTPYHFLTAAAMSEQSSNPVRELRYQNNDADIGVRHLQSLGVRYAMVRTDEAKREAREQEELVLLDTVGPWEIYRVADSEVVVPLQVQPVVVAGREGDQRERNLELGTSWFQQPDEWAAIPADDGPESWQRISVEVDESRAIPERDRPADDPDTRGKQVDIVVPSTPIDPVALPGIEVSDVEMDQEGLSFRVDQVGVPVLVKVSYFPNWDVSGAEGPFRIAPNFMVVVPTEQDVQLTYGRSGSDLLFYLMTAAGIALVIFLRLKGDVDLDGPARTDDTATSTGSEPPSEDDTDGAFAPDRPPAWAGAPPPVWAGGPASPSHSPAEVPAPPAGDIAVGPEVGPPGSSPPSTAPSPPSEGHPGHRDGPPVA